MKIQLSGDAGSHEIDIAVTHTLDDLAGRIQDAYGVSDARYRFDFGGTIYSPEGDPDSRIHHCDLLIYTGTPAVYYSDDLAARVCHENISDTIYDYCDFENPHYCPVFEEIIDIDACYESMMCLNGFFAIESSEELTKIGDVDTARDRCRRCIYTNCDGIHREQTKRGVSLRNITPSQADYRIHLTKPLPVEIEAVRSAFLAKYPEPDDTEE